MMEALGSSETSVLKRATRRNIQKDDILRSHRIENLKSYIVSERAEIWSLVPETRMTVLANPSSVCYYAVLCYAMLFIVRAVKGT
jgi:hypothetical protein